MDSCQCLSVLGKAHWRYCVKRTGKVNVLLRSWAFPDTSISDEGGWLLHRQHSCLLGRQTVGGQSCPYRRIWVWYPSVSRVCWRSNQSKLLGAGCLLTRENSYPSLGTVHWWQLCTTCFDHSSTNSVWTCCLALFLLAHSFLNVLITDRVFYVCL